MSNYTVPTYKTKQALEKKLDEFKQWFIDNPEKKPSKARLNVFLGVADSTRRSWKNAGHEFTDIILSIEEWIKAETIDLAFDGNKHAEFQLSRAFNMREKTQLETVNTHTVLMPSVKIGDKNVSFDVGDE